jgi:tetratricopeptide (TPR) repeat protein
MGLYDEAVKAFKKVIESPGREVQCRLMIGLCYREQGNRTDAITQFKAGLHVPGISTSEQLMLYYEIAYSYEMVKDPKEARYFYQLVAKRDPGYRDVEDRMLALGGVRYGGSDADAAIDSLLSEDNTNPGE